MIIYLTYDLLFKRNNNIKSMVFIKCLALATFRGLRGHFLWRWRHLLFVSAAIYILLSFTTSLLLDTTLVVAIHSHKKS